MRHLNLTRACYLLPLLASAALLPACSSNPPPPPEAPAAPPPVAAEPVPPPPPPAAEPAKASVEAPPPEAPKPPRGHHHALLELFDVGLDSLTLTPEQKPTIDAIKADLAAHSEAPKAPREKLEADVVAGVAAGKIERSKTDADIKAMSAALAATQPAMQEDMNRLHKALTPEQRKQLIETMREKGQEMHRGLEHSSAPMGKAPAAGPPMHDHDHGPMGSGHGGAGIDHVMGKLSEDLGLSPEQKNSLQTKLTAQMAASHGAMKQKMTTVIKHMDAVGSAFQSPQFDAKKAGVGRDAADVLQALAQAKVQFVETVLSVLTPEQRPKFVAHLEAHAGEMD